MATNKTTDIAAADRPLPIYGGRRATHYRAAHPVASLPIDRKTHSVSFTHDDLDLIELRFDAETPGSC